MNAEAAGLKVTTPTDLEIVMTRSFAAPRQLVWDAMTRPELVQRWMFAPPGWTWAKCEMDVHVGGKFHWAWNGPDGQLGLTITGEHRVVDAPNKIVHTELMQMGSGPDGDPMGPPWELLATLELSESAGKTYLKMSLLFPTKEGRDGALASGMEHGVAAGYDALERMLASGKS